MDNVSVGTIPSYFSDFSERTEEDLTKLHHTYYSVKKSSTAKLMINDKKEAIVDMIETNSVVILQGPTGCGKTTQVPQFILDRAVEKKVHCNIIGNFFNLKVTYKCVFLFR